MSGKAQKAALIAGAAVAVLGGGLWLAERDAAPSGMAIVTPTMAATATPAPTATMAPILVHVAGAVREPGVYALPPDARVLDAVEAAGGLTAEADADLLNLADHLQDAMRLYIPTQGEQAPVAPTPIAVTQAGPPGQATGGLININTATPAELETLPHVGEAIAGRIVAYREANGPFQRIEDLQQVSGIGDKTYADLQDLITVE